MPETAVRRWEATPSSIIAWEGPSLLTGGRIQLVITGLLRPSQNAKTGPMVQVWVVPAGVNPSTSLGTDRERDVCGECPLRGRGSARVCYVAAGVWHLARHLPTYPRMKIEDAAAAIAGKAVRLCAYGDIAAVPFGVVRALLARARTYTGYTHQWRICDHRLRAYVMASVETVEDARTAQARGWRTFRIRSPQGHLKPSEIVCPNESRGVQCIRCGICCGTASSAPSVVITIHGRGREAWLTARARPHGGAGVVSTRTGPRRVG